MTRLHATKKDGVWLAARGWTGHAAKELSRRRAAAKVARASRKANRR